MKTRRAPHIWPVAIIAVFLVFISGLAAFIAFASSRRDDLVRPDYYEEEIRYQRQIDRIQRTRNIGQPASIRYDAQRRRITIQLPPGHTRDSSGIVQLYRPADARLDREFPLAIGSDGAQHLDAIPLRAGPWKVRVRWSAAGEEFFLEQAIVLPPS